MSHFSISAEQRQRLLAGDYRPLVFDILPYGCQTGARYVVVRQRARKIAIRDENDIVGVADIPEVPLFWITVTQVLGGPDRRWERPDGDWLVRFDVEDHRDTPRFLAAATGYTSSRWRAVDARPAVSEGEQRRQTKERTVEWFKAENVVMRRQQREADQQRRNQGLRLEEAKRQARLRGVDLSAEERLIERKLRQMEAKVQGENGEDLAA